MAALQPSTGFYGVSSFIFHSRSLRTSSASSQTENMGKSFPQMICQCPRIQRWAVFCSARNQWSDVRSYLFTLWNITSVKIHRFDISASESFTIEMPRIKTACVGNWETSVRPSRGGVYSVSVSWGVAFGPVNLTNGGLLLRSTNICTDWITSYWPKTVLYFGCLKVILTEINSCKKIHNRLKVWFKVGLTPEFNWYSIKTHGKTRRMLEHHKSLVQTLSGSASRVWHCSRSVAHLEKPCRSAVAFGTHVCR